MPAIYHQSFDLYLQNRKSISTELYRDSTFTSEWIQEFFVVNQPSSWFNKYQSWRQYDMGAMLVEVLTALKGPGSTMEIWKLMGMGQTFNQAFEKVYGTSFDKASANNLKGNCSSARKELSHAAQRDPGTGFSCASFDYNTSSGGDS
jgi:hypothetical protein